MRFDEIGIQDNISVGVYDATKTSIFGDVSQHVTDGANVIGPRLTGFYDPFTDNGGTFTVAANSIAVTDNGHLFCANVAAGVITIALYNWNNTTKVRGSLVGKIQMNTPNSAATTHVIRRISVYNDSGPTDWKIAVLTTGSVLINGGPFIINKVNLADFTSTPTLFGLAIANDAKAAYMLQDPNAIGVANGNPVTQGLAVINGGEIDQTGGVLYLQNGLLLNARLYGFDLTTAPNIVSLHAAATAQTTPYAGTAPNAYFSTAAATTAMQTNDPVVITANAPTGFTNTTATVQTVYFARDIQTVLGTVYFNLSATSGGAAIVPTGNSTGIQVTRAFGQSTNTFIAGKATGIVNTAFTGVILATGSQRVLTAQNTGTALDGQLCYFLGTSTNAYLFRVTDITSGAVTLPTASTVNILGTGSDIVAPTALQMQFVPEIGQIVYATGTSSFVTKGWVNNAITASFAGQKNQWYENSGLESVDIGTNAIGAMFTYNGCIFVSGTTAGQRIIAVMNLMSDITFGLSYAISPVFETSAQLLKFIQTYERLFDITDSLQFYVRTAPTSGDAEFSTTTSGTWTAIPNNETIIYTPDNYSQIKVGWYVATFFANSPAQLEEILWGYDLKTDNDYHWACCNDGSTQGGGSPSETVFELIKAYPTSVPTLYAHDTELTTYNSVGVLDTVGDAANFSYSTDVGVSWNPLGTIPNVVGTRVKVTRTYPGATLAFVSLRTS